MFLTRIGFGSKAVITGDVSQVDLPLTQLSGLIDAERIMKRVQGIAITRLTSADVVRHPLVARIVDAYDKQRSPKADVNAADEDADDVVDVKARGSAKPTRKTRRKV